MTSTAHVRGRWSTIRVQTLARSSAVSSYTSSSLTLRSLLKSAASRLRLGVPAPKVSGLTGPAKALFGAAAAERGLTSWSSRPTPTSRR